MNVLLIACNIVHVVDQVGQEMYCTRDFPNRALD